MKWPEYADGIGVDAIKELHDAAKQLLLAIYSKDNIERLDRLLRAIKDLEGELEP